MAEGRHTEGRMVEERREGTGSIPVLQKNAPFVVRIEQVGFGMDLRRCQHEYSIFDVVHHGPQAPIDCCQPLLSTLLPVGGSVPLLHSLQLLHQIRDKSINNFVAPLLLLGGWHEMARIEVSLIRWVATCSLHKPLWRRIAGVDGVVNGHFGSSVTSHAHPNWRRQFEPIHLLYCRNSWFVGQVHDCHPGVIIEGTEVLPILFLINAAATPGSRVGKDSENCPVAVTIETGKSFPKNDDTEKPKYPVPASGIPHGVGVGKAPSVLAVSLPVGLAFQRNKFRKVHAGVTNLFDEIM